VEDEDVEAVLAAIDEENGGREEAEFVYLKELLKKARTPLILGRLARFYLEGLIPVENLDKALTLARESADEEMIRLVEERIHQLNAGKAEMDPNALAHLTAAQAGDALESLYVAFSFLYSENGFPRSPRDAYNILRAAGKKSPDVYVVLGILFEKGAQFHKNARLSLKYYHMANRGGSTSARMIDWQVLVPGSTRMDGSHMGCAPASFHGIDGTLAPAAAHWLNAIRSPFIDLAVRVSSRCVWGINMDSSPFPGDPRKRSKADFLQQPNDIQYIC
jgi:hypothetical protein